MTLVERLEKIRGEIYGLYPIGSVRAGEVVDEFNQIIREVKYLEEFEEELFDAEYDNFSFLTIQEIMEITSLPSRSYFTKLIKENKIKSEFVNKMYLVDKQDFYKKYKGYLRNGRW